MYSKIIIMRTNIDIDEKVLKEAQKNSDLKSKKELVNTALREFSRLQKRRKMKSLFGKVEWEGDLKMMRSI